MTKKTLKEVLASVEGKFPFPINLAIKSAVTALYFEEQLDEIKKICDHAKGIVKGIAKGELVVPNLSRDKAPFLLEPGELRMPKKSFNEMLVIMKKAPWVGSKNTLTLKQFKKGM